MPRFIGSGLAVSALLGAFGFGQQRMLLPAEQDARLAEVAVELAQRGPVTAIPLLAEGSRPLGAVYDRLRIGALAARARLAAGEPVDAAVVEAHPAWRSRAQTLRSAGAVGAGAARPDRHPACAARHRDR